MNTCRCSSNVAGNMPRQRLHFRLRRNQMRKLTFSLLVISISLPALLVPLTAQTEYSIAGANAYVARKDWNALLNYTQGWSRASPNDPMPWY
jgi:hypothetical protein